MHFSIVLIFLQLQYCFGDVLVDIKQGRIKGKLRKDRLGNDFYSFQSIPYAKPPINELRFKAPKPANSWKGTLDGTKDVPKCYQREDTALVGQEDCLYLNVYTKKINANHNGELLPVMVFIHGGSLTEGSASESFVGGPEHLLVEDIVLVTINYRLGIFGYLSFKDQSSGVPGNAGFKDQVMALKWVNKNIHKFGGNCSRVTIFGQSSGAASVHLHVLSPMSEGLFQRAILQSGTAISAWAYGILGTGKLLAETLGIESDDTKEILQQLRHVSAEKIFESQEKFFSASRIYDRVHAGPVIETQTNEPVFLPDDPVNIIRSGTYNKVPLMAGYTSSEAIFFYVVAYFSGIKGPLVKLNETVPFNLNILNNSKLVNEVVNEMKTFYFGGQTPTDEDVFQYIKLDSSIFFVYPALSAVNAHLNNLVHPIYFYVFSADTKLNLYKRSTNETATYPGAGHADELPYLFNFSSAGVIEKGSVEEKSVERMVKLWTNFAKFGKPVPATDNIINCAWEPTAKEKFNYLDIGTHGLTKQVKPNEDDYNFWKSIYKRYTQK